MLKALKIKDELKLYKEQRENMCDQMVQEPQEIYAPEWKLEGLEIVLKQLKTNKSIDPLGFANELFTPIFQEII